MNTTGEVTQVLAEMARGDEDAATRLLPIVYDELRRLAAQYLRGEHAAQTLQPTALVHEVYLKLVGTCSFEDRAQFFSVAARAMRRLLIDHARRRCAARRGGGRPKVTLDEVIEPTFDRDDYIVALDDALTELTAVDAELARVVELRFFGGLTIDETARVLDVSPMTIKRMWKLARGWLHREITG